MTQFMKVRIDGELVDREVANMTIAIQEDGSHVEYPEPKLNPGEVVYGRGVDSVQIIYVSPKD